MTNEQLIELAIKARENATPVISNFAVGAALETINGDIYTGSNIEDKACLRLGTCAERVAFYKAIDNRETEFTKIAVVGGKKGESLIKTLPCGICRQFIQVYAPNLKIIY